MPPAIKRNLLLSFSLLKESRAHFYPEIASKLHWKLLSMDAKLMLILSFIWGMFQLMYITGWSKETVNCNFFLTGLKITKSGITEPFLVRAHREVLIFWCLEGVRWKKYPILGLCQNGGLAPARPDSAWTEPARHLQTLQDNPQTFLRIVWECLLVSFYAWFIFGNVRGHLGLSWGGCFRVF